jgi:hypothetical protein
MDVAEPAGPPGPLDEPSLSPEPVGSGDRSDLLDLTDPQGTAWPWETLRAEQEARPGSFTDAIRHEYRWDEDGFTRLEAAMRAACVVLQEQKTIDRWVGEGFWCWTAVVPELTEHPRFAPPETTYLRECLARLRDLGSWFFNGTSPYGPDHVWEPVQRLHF